MSLTESLLAIDKERFTKKMTGQIELPRLSKLTGEPFYIKCKEISDDRIVEIQAFATKKDGTYDIERSRDANALVCCAGVIEPDLSNKELQAKLDAATPKDLAKKLFKGDELGLVADYIIELATVVNSDEEEEEKNV